MSATRTVTVSPQLLSASEEKSLLLIIVVFAVIFRLHNYGGHPHRLAIWRYF